MRITIRVQPGASRTHVGGMRHDQLHVAVSAAAVDGKANQAVCRAVADAFGLRSRQVQLVAGERNRTKQLHLEGDEVELTARYQELLHA